MRLKIGIARGVIAICLASTAISGVALALDRGLDRPPPADAIAAADPTDPSGIAITPSQNAPGVPPAPRSTAAVPATANSSPGSSVTLAPNTVPLPPPSPGATPASPLLTQAQLAQLVAPIALYPDPLLAQILMASTYPLEVVEAARWVNVNGNRVLKDDALTGVLQVQNWDPSVKALVPFPRILQMMSDQLQWTEALGNAFLAQQADVMAAVQSLRQEAMVAGNLKQTPQCRCVIHSGGGAISILPAEPQVVCPPVYTPAVYGVWPFPAYPPYYFPVPVGFAFAPLLDRFCATHRARGVRTVLGLGRDRLGTSLDRRRHRPSCDCFRRALVFGQCVGAQPGPSRWCRLRRSRDTRAF